MKQKKEERPENEPRRSPVRSPEYTEAALKKGIRIERAALLQLAERYNIAREVRTKRIDKLEAGLAELRNGQVELPY